MPLEPALAPDLGAVIRNLEHRIAILERRKGGSGGAVASGFTVETDTVDTFETTASTTYTDLTTPGPEITIDLVSGVPVIVTIDCHLCPATSGSNGAVASFEIAGPSTSDLAVADTNAIESGVPANDWCPGSKTTVFLPTASGSHVMTVKYKVIGAVTGNFKYRRITAYTI